MVMPVIGFYKVNELPVEAEPNAFYYIQRTGYVEAWLTTNTGAPVPIGSIAVLQWGEIEGDIELQADLVALLAGKQDSASLGSAAFADASSFATAAQGLIAENVATLVEDKLDKSSVKGELGDSKEFVINQSKVTEMFQLFASWLDVPKADAYADFENNRYFKDGMPCRFEDIFGFERLSEAATFSEDGLKVWGVDEPRVVDGKGLLIEPEATNAFVRGDFTKTSVKDLTATEYLIEPAFSKTHKVTKLVGMGEDREGLFEYYSDAVERSESGAGPRRLSLYIKASEEVEFVSLNMYATIANNHQYRFVVNLKTLTVTQRDKSQTSDVVIENKGDGWVRVSFTYVPNSPYSVLYASFGKTGDSPTHPSGWHCLSGGDEVLLALPEHYTNNPKYYISSIPTNEISQVTRSPDLLNIPLLPTQTITGDWDEDVTYEVADNIATFAGHGYIRNITVEEL